MKVGILGSGFMGRTHARAYAKMKGVEVAAVTSRHLDKAQKLADEVGGRATTDNMAVIDDPSIDAISNTLPTHLHAEYTIAALKAGKHVLLEKPFALTAVGCDGMIAAQKESGKVLLVASGMAACPLPARRRRRGSPSCAPRQPAGRSNPAQWLRFSTNARTTSTNAGYG